MPVSQGQRSCSQEWAFVFWALLTVLSGTNHHLLASALRHLPGRNFGEAGGAAGSALVVYEGTHTDPWSLREFSRLTARDCTMLGVNRVDRPASDPRPRFRNCFGDQGAAGRRHTLWGGEKQEMVVLYCSVTGNMEMEKRSTWGHRASKEIGGAGGKKTLAPVVVLIALLSAACLAYVLRLLRPGGCSGARVSLADGHVNGQVLDCDGPSEPGFELRSWKEKENKDRINALPTVHVDLLNIVIGRGGFGKVEKGVMNGCEVAVKFGNGVGKQGFCTLVNEIKVLEQVIPNENIVQCLGVFEDRLRVGIVEELMCMNLNDWMYGVNFREQTTLKEVISVFIGITKGLEHLHKFRVVHYDLKPQNILLDDKMVPKIADFGCSKFKASSYITAGLCGTIGYIAPECIFSVYCELKQRVCAEKIDIFSLGVLMRELLTREGPSRPRDHLNFTTNSLSETTSPQAVSSSLGSPGKNTTRGVSGMNDLSLNFQLPLVYPEELRKLVADCTNVNNRDRPSCSVVRRRLDMMLKAPWAGQTLSRVDGL